MRTRHPQTECFAKLVFTLVSAGLVVATSFSAGAQTPVPQAVTEDAATAKTAGLALVSDRVQIAAHRGGYESDKADNAPENSVANIGNCHRKGYAIYETDIQRTKDGRFVIMHDPTMDRETTGTGAASQFELTDLRKLFKRFRDRSVSEHRIATLDEFLLEGKNRVIFKADLKPGVNRHFHEIIDLVVQLDAMESIVFRVPYRDANLYADYRADGVPYTADMLMFMVSNQTQVDDIQSRFNPSTIQINLDKRNPTNAKTLELIRYATAKGLMVETHAEGTSNDWRKLIEAGVRMLHTGKPAKMQAFLHEHGF